MVIRRTVAWGVQIGQVYCKFFHKLTKKQKRSHIYFSLPLIHKAELSHMRPHTQTDALIKQKQNVTHKLRPKNVTHLTIVKNKWQKKSQI